MVRNEGTKNAYKILVLKLVRKRNGGPRLMWGIILNWMLNKWGMDSLGTG